MAKELLLDGNTLTISSVEKFLFTNQKVKLSQNAKRKINESRKLVEKWISEEKVIYGVTTGFGEFANVNISFDQIKQLQENLIISHAVGVGEMLPLFIVKIMMLLRVNALAKGHSGIRISTIELLIEMINKNIIPLIPSQGSVGSSGDLAPLSHLVLAMIGKGKVFDTITGYYLSNGKDGSYQRVTKNAFSDVFPNADVKGIIKANGLKMNKQDDLIQLFNECQ